MRIEFSDSGDTDSYIETVVVKTVPSDNTWIEILMECAHALNGFGYHVPTIELDRWMQGDYSGTED